MMVGVIKISNSFWDFFFELVLKNLRKKVNPLKLEISQPLSRPGQILNHQLTVFHRFLP